MIVDTNALSAAADAEPAAESAFAGAREVAVPVIVLGEFLFGIAQSRRRSEYRKWLDNILGTLVALDVTAETAAKYSEIRQELKRAGTPIPHNDLWIAALCRQHSQPILSRDRHFDQVPGLRRIGW